MLTRLLLASEYISMKGYGSTLSNADESTKGKGENMIMPCKLSIIFSNQKAEW